MKNKWLKVFREKIKKYRKKKSCLDCKNCKFDCAWMSFFCKAKVIEKGEKITYNTSVSKYIEIGIPSWCPGIRSNHER